MSLSLRCFQTARTSSNKVSNEPIEMNIALHPDYAAIIGQLGINVIMIFVFAGSVGTIGHAIMKGDGKRHESNQKKNSSLTGEENLS
jgi:hypothetical protein